MGAGARFRAFEFDPRSCELRRNGARVHMQELPLRLLEQLLARPGELVSREELRHSLWPDKEFGDFERGLNTAMRKLREALADDAVHPELIETVPRRGYRWVGKLEAPATPPPAAPSAAPRRRRQRWPWLAAAGLAAAFLLWDATPLPPPRVLRVAQVTTRARIDTPVRPISDGVRVFYMERDGDHWDLMQTAITGGDPQPVPAPGPSAVVLDASLRSARLLLGSFIGRDVGERLWTMPIQGGPAVEISAALTGGAAFSPDGRQIAYVLHNAIWMMDADGANPHQLLPLPNGAGWLSWSPDGSRLRFSMDDRGHAAIWEASSTGQGLHVVLASGPWGSDACCGAWTADGRSYVFTATRDGRSNLWALRDGGAWWRRSPRGPFQLTHGPDDPADGTPALRGNRLLYYNGVFHSEAARVNRATGAYGPDPHPFADSSIYSPDKAWIAYLDPATGALMRSRADGSQRQELAPASLHPVFPRWSPDGRWIAFGGFDAGQPPDAYMVPSSGGGGVAEELPMLGDIGDPDWAPDGNQLVISRAPDAKHPELRALEIFNAKTRHSEVIPGSQSLDAARWSYDGRFISATSYDQHQLKLYDVARRQWRVLAHGNALGIGEWSPDSRLLYFQDLLGPGQRLMRFDARTGRTSLVADFTAALHDDVYRCAFYGVEPDGSPVMRFERGGLDLFAATVDWP